jgi:tetratricopeptide (TPR) repeat protein
MGRDSEALGSINRAIEMNPLNWAHYFIRAQMRLKLGQPHNLALEDFGRARTLEPNYALPCFEEGEIWRQYNPELAIPAWREFLSRGTYGRDGHYELMLQRTANIPGMNRKLRELARSLSLKIIYIKNTNSKEEFDSMLREILDSGGVIEGLLAEDRTSFFRLWQKRGDREHLRAFLEKNPLIQSDSWSILAEERARTGQFKEAYELAVKFIPLPTSAAISGIQDLSQLERNFLFNQTDPRRGVDLYFALKSQNKLNEALSTLEKVSRLPDAPKYIPYEMATIYARKQDFRTAWEMIQSYMNLR